MAGQRLMLQGLLAPALALLAFVVLGGVAWAEPSLWKVGAALGAGGLVGIAIVDLLQTRHALLRNYPILAHIRFFLESIRPEMRQYFVEADGEATPFSRQQRSVVYQRAKNVLDKRPFGTLLDVYGDDHEWLNHSMAPVKIAKENSDFRVSVGGPDCLKPYSISVFNISAMSFGALSGRAVQALNRGAAIGGFAHDTGEGSISLHHRPLEAGAPAGDLIWEIGSGYFGCRDQDGRFDADKFIENACDPQVRMIEIKLSQGAKPGHGGVLPGAKVSAEIAEARGVEPGQDCISPAAHSAFSTPLELIAFIARLRDLSGGKPVGVKLAIGHPWEFYAVCKAMLETGITPDFIVIDGAEGGTGAAPVEFADHVGVPLREALLLVHNTLVGLNLRSRIRLGASGKIITAFDIARAMAMGADWCNSARGFMFALGCVQSLSCHTDRCPTGIATQNPLRQRALVVGDKAERVAHFHRNTLMALAELIGAAGLSSPMALAPHHIVRRVSGNEVRNLTMLYKFMTAGELLRNPAAHQLFERYWPMASSHSFAAQPLPPAATMAAPATTIADR
ncbi:FMN-binding glutamate synthase family protein [Nevskia sp.]|uniref:FMN-binding glutamate synthase family protein n=1 Tax=Nevskia sp. TaxID=1929292 RepID=UPI0025E95BEE|nr:FMN-binding glutamate synthase family protein [Nevskia sp.]